MKQLKTEIISELEDLESKAMNGVLQYSDLEKVRNLCETFLMLHEVCSTISGDGGIKIPSGNQMQKEY